MANFHIAPSAAWGSSAPKLNRSVKSRVGDAIRALTPRTRRTGSNNATEDDTKVHILNVDLLAELGEHDKMKRRWSDGGTSTRSGTSSSSAEVTSLPGSVEEVSLPSCASSDSSPGLPSTDLYDDEEDPKCRQEVAPTACSHRSRKNALHQMALLISHRAADKYLHHSGRVYQDVRNAFLAADSDSDGKLSPAEATAFCNYFDLSPEIATRLFSLLDPHESGAADWSTFLAKFAPVFREETNWRLNPNPLTAAEIKSRLHWGR